jgi:ribonuclease HI
MKKQDVIRVFTDGREPSPDGHKPAFAWARADGRGQSIQERDGITSNEAEYLAFLSAVEAMPGGANLEIVTDSLLAKAQLNGEYRIRDVNLAKLAGQIKTVAHKKNIALKVSWVPRKENRAGKLL